MSNYPRALRQTGGGATPPRQTGGGARIIEYVLNTGKRDIFALFFFLVRRKEKS